MCIDKNNTTLNKIAKNLRGWKRMYPISKSSLYASQYTISIHTNAVVVMVLLVHDFTHIHEKKLSWWTISIIAQIWVEWHHVWRSSNQKVVAYVNSVQVVSLQHPIVTNNNMPSNTLEEILSTFFGLFFCNVPCIGPLSNDHTLTPPPNALPCWRSPGMNGRCKDTSCIWSWKGTTWTTLIIVWVHNLK